jgi:hypothetical protein
MKRYPLSAILFGLVLAASPAFAQYPIIAPPVTYGDPSLRNIDIGLTIPTLGDAPGAEMDRWSSSFLKAEGTAPVKPEPGADDDTWELESEYSFAYARWASMYSARSLMDNDPATAWAESAPGPGIGEVAIALIPGLEGIGIRSGFQRSAELFAKNARPRRVRVWLLAAGRMDVTEIFEYYIDVKALACLEAELEDKMGWQPLPLPRVSALPTPATMPGGPEGEGTIHWFVALQILSAYPGSRWADCCISDIGPMD